jgi:hypothetical protein
MAHDRGDAQMRRPQPDDRVWPGSTGTPRPGLPRAGGRTADLLAGSHARRHRSATGILVVISVLIIELTVPHVPLPSPPAAAHGSRAGRAGICWVVEAVATRADRQTLAEGRATLRKAGLPVQIWRGGRETGIRPGRSTLVIPFASKATAEVARTRIRRLGFSGTGPRRLPRSVCLEMRRRRR